MARKTKAPVQQFRGTTAQHATYTGPSGELTVDVTKKVVVVQDGATAGGVPMAPEQHSTPVATVGTAGHVYPGTGLTVSGAGALSVAYGTTAGTSVQGNDPRLTDDRPPAAHASTHAIGGSDPLENAVLKATAAQVGLGVEADAFVTPSVMYPAFASVVSAATCNIGAVASDKVYITGANTITSFGVAVAGLRRVVRFSSTATLTYNATKMILPGGKNIVTAANDSADFISLGSGNWYCDAYQRAAELDGGNVDTVNGIVPDAVKDVKVTIPVTQSQFDALKTAGTLVRGATYVITDAEPVIQTASSVPRGIIALWSGGASAVPSGWSLCDGSNDTPDLQDKFVLGAGSTYAVGDSGGASTVTSGATTLTTAQMPSHTHYITSGGVLNRGYGYVTGQSLATDGPVTTNASGGSQSHTHTVDTMPPYYALAYIMKL